MGHAALASEGGDDEDLGMGRLLEVRQSKVGAVHAAVVVDLHQPTEDGEVLHVLEFTTTTDPSP
jgi:hypothetical protein